MTHDEIVQSGAKWLKNKCSIVVTELTSWASESPDVIGFNTQGSILIECKASRADFLSDKKKSFRRRPENGMGIYRYYLAPKDLISANEVPDDWGLLRVTARGVGVVKKARAQEVDHHNEKILLMSCLCRIGQDAPKGISVRCYTHETKNTASISVDSNNH